MHRTRMIAVEILALIHDVAEMATAEESPGVAPDAELDAFINCARKLRDREIASQFHGDDMAYSEAIAWLMTSNSAR